jgi:NCS1 family nucleobase:cation symporter-1
VLWNPVDIINHWMDSGSHGGRAAAAFAAIGLIIVTLGINISANSISAANDLMSFWPKYINIRRGQVLAAFIGSWGFVPVSMLTHRNPDGANDRSGKSLLQPPSSSHSWAVTRFSWVP